MLLLWFSDKRKEKCFYGEKKNYQKKTIKLLFLLKFRIRTHSPLRSFYFIQFLL